MLFVFLLVGCGLCADHVVVHRSSSSMSKRIINGIEFEHVVNSINGTCSEQYLVGGVPLEPEEYQHRLEQAYGIMTKQQDQAQLSAHKTKETLKAGLSEKILDQDLRELLDQLYQSIKILQHPILEKYRMYHGNISNQQMFMEVDKMLKDMKSKVPQLLQEHDLMALDKMKNQLMKLNQDLQVMVEKTVQQAIARCDDTLALKEVLELIH